MNDFTAICRVCMTKNVELISIYQCDDDMLTYIDKLNTCIPEIFTEDNYIPLPDKLCAFCCKHLKIAFWFRELCLKTNTILRTYKHNLECKLSELNERLEIDKDGFGEGQFEILEDLCQSEFIKVEIEVVGTINDEKDLDGEVSSTTPIATKDLNPGQIKSEVLDANNREDNSLSVDNLQPMDLNTLNKLKESQSNEIDGNVNKQDIKSKIQIEQKEDFPAASKKLDFICSTCNKPFRSLQELRIHERIHSTYKPYTCTACLKSFSKLLHLKTHVNTHVNKQSFTCPACSKTYLQKSNLFAHMKLHTQSKRFVCETCGKAFARSNHLKKHSLFHGSDRPYSCDVCNENFMLKHHLKRHMLTHSGNTTSQDVPRKKFSCTICKWSFMSKHVLQRHIKMHSRANAKLRKSFSDDKQRFQCTICEWNFIRKQNLDRHMLTHEKKFKCTECSYSFTKNSELLLHLKKVHAQNSTNVKIRKNVA